MGDLAVTIDPGRQVGLAFWDTTRWGDLIPPVDTGMVIPNPKLPWEDQIETMLINLEHHLARYRGRLWYAYMEQPKFMEERGMAAARDGALAKLLLSAGMIFQMVRSFGCMVEWVPVNWKGQMPKEAVINRIRKRLGDEACKHFDKHIWDAVGIGLHVKGFPL